jgi:hypothetical protein
MLHELPDLSRLLDSAPARSNSGAAITLVRLRDDVIDARSLDEPNLEGQIAAYAAQQLRVKAAS